MRNRHSYINFTLIVLLRVLTVLPGKMGESLTQFPEEPWQIPQDGRVCNSGPLPFPQEPLATHCEAS